MGFLFKRIYEVKVFDQLFKANDPMARELTKAIKLYLILGALKSLPTIILLGVDSVTPYCKHILVNSSCH